MAGAVLALHLAVIAFNFFGLVATPLGAWIGWGWVRAFWWRALHLASMAVVALQALAGRACFLTLWQSDLESRAAEPAPMIARWVNSIVYWPLPIWVFTAFYVLLLVYVVALWRLGPPRRR